VKSLTLSIDFDNVSVRQQNALKGRGLREFSLALCKEEKKNLKKKHGRPG
jgi:hypothetical protein